MHRLPYQLLIKNCLITFFCFSFFTSLTFAQSKNTFDLIEIALEAKEISEAQAVLYRALAFRGDEGLPERFKGDLSVPQEKSAGGDLYASEIMNIIKDLNAEEEILALRLIAPPAYVPNVSNLTAPNKANATPLPNPDPLAEWKVVETLDAKIWYLESDPKGEAGVLNVKEAFPNVLQKLRQISGRAPLKDDQEAFEYTLRDGTKVKLGNGGNGKIDIYLMPFAAGTNTFAYAQPYKGAFSKEATPGFIVMNTADIDSVRLFKSTLMHETMHLIQFSYPKKLNHASTYKVGEGVAKWSEDYWDSTFQYEHKFWKFFYFGWLSLKTETYDTWPFYYYVTKTHGIQTIDKIYSMMADNDPYKAIDLALPGGFKNVWPEYTRKEWNQYPPDNDSDFKKWDDYLDVPWEDTTQPVRTKSVKVDANVGDYVFQKTMKLKPLTREYLDFEFEESGRNHSISIGMTHFWKKSKVTLRAMIETDEGWRIEKWDSQYENKEICFDKKNERIKRLILIYSNFEYRDLPAAEFEARVSSTNLGCYGYEGHVDSEFHSNSDSRSSWLSISTDATFIAAKPIISDPTSGPHFPGRFELAKIKLNYHYKGNDDRNCVADKSGDISASGESLAKYGSIGLYAFNDHTTGGFRSISGAIGHPQANPIIITYVCPDGKTYNIHLELPVFSSGANRLGANIIDYEGIFKIPNGESKYKFSPIEEP